jgi:protoheme IX farnesyltransferase
MIRTRHRALPSKRIYPPEKVLPLTIGMIVVALALAWWLHPWAALGGMVGVIAAMIARGRTLSHFLGGISSVSPVLVGWFSIDPRLSPALLLLCLLVFVWVPLHVWSVILAWREDHLNAGLRVFPATWEPRAAVKVLFALSFALYAISLALYFWGGFGFIYLGAANILGLAVIVGSYRLWKSKVIWDAWLVYKLSAYPYLGLTFLALALDLWL